MLSDREIVTRPVSKLLQWLLSIDLLPKHEGWLRDSDARSLTALYVSGFGLTWQCWPCRRSMPASAPWLLESLACKGFLLKSATRWARHLAEDQRWAASNVQGSFGRSLRTFRARWSPWAMAGAKLPIYARNRRVFTPVAIRNLKDVVPRPAIFKKDVVRSSSTPIDTVSVRLWGGLGLEGRSK